MLPETISSFVSIDHLKKGIMLHVVVDACDANLCDCLQHKNFVKALSLYTSYMVYKLLEAIIKYIITRHLE